MKKDTIFKNKKNIIKKFEFNSEVASVFDDMISRSVPFYDEIHKIIKDISDRVIVKKDTIHDLGCSTGTTINILYQHLNCQSKPVKFIGVDNSPSMLKICDEKLKSANIKNVELICQDIEKMQLETSGMVIMNYTLQFISPEKRIDLLKNIYKSLRKNGAFILSEKIKCQNITINDLFTDLYHDFKRRNGYSELEISQKREALENVLIPLTPEKQISLMKSAGFKKVETIFRWYNFACFIGIK